MMLQMYNNGFAMPIITFDYVAIVTILILLVGFLFPRFIVTVVASLALLMVSSPRLFMLSAAASYLSFSINELGKLAWALLNRGSNHLQLYKPSAPPASGSLQAGRETR